MSDTAATRRAHVLIAAERLPTRVGLRLALEPEARCTEAADQRQHLRAGVALSDDLEVGRLLEGSLYALDNETMIVGDEHAHGQIVVGRSAGFELAVA